MDDPRIAVDIAAAEPPFEQCRAQLAGLRVTGRLLPGDRLPTVRALTADLGLGVHTVARAFEELEAAGLEDAAAIDLVRSALRLRPRPSRPTEPHEVP
ncbi:GntR family transcriptional regulator [Terrabacter sp. MAHUQ-38]|uniref:GntR family transcriptional regulator n=1 Tax=unclassified Terrabacter TaxID=2630222 RepID=UPI00165D959D|nr:GntR family transcriptional regulator [Terrabacter sp. MAHUQ-38]MBC9824024.1 GntR family transcriptional regulator [Terrabacter sp. MAHUQ-38]